MKYRKLHECFLYIHRSIRPYTDFYNQSTAIITNIQLGDNIFRICDTSNGICTFWNARVVLCIFSFLSIPSALLPYSPWYLFSVVTIEFLKNNDFSWQSDPSSSVNYCINTDEICRYDKHFVLSVCLSLPPLSLSV